jgi:hypothetical protein
VKKTEPVSPFIMACAVAAILMTSAKAADASPAKVFTSVKETDLANLILTVRAEERLGITTATVERKKVARTRFYGADLVLPSPVITPDERGRHAGQSVFPILPSLSSAELVRLAQSQIDADGQIEQARVQVQAARVALNRAEQVLREKAGSVRSVDEARAQSELAEAALRRAQAQRELLGAPVLGADEPAVLWVRVPVYVGDIRRIDPNANALIGGFGGEGGDLRHQAAPVPAPPSANPGAATVDFFYALTNGTPAFRLGEKVGATLALKEDEDSPVVPWSAVVHDVQGGAWVYENVGPQSYARRRVQVRYVHNREAVLARGPMPGAKVAVTGVAELFGTEFGIGK